MSRDILEPNSTIGIIGGGQLGRMMALAAKFMGYRIVVLDPSPDSPCGQVADQKIIANYTDGQALKKLAEMADVLTYEFENVNVKALQKIENQVNVPQGSRLLEITQDRILEKQYLSSCQVKLAPYVVVNDQTDLLQAICSLDYPVILKTVRGGYDGKGQVLLRSEEDLEQALNLFQQGICVLEKQIALEKEISVVVTGNRNGQIEVFPVSENIHQNHILHQSIVPARISSTLAEKVENLAKKIAESLSLQGNLAIEMFVSKAGELLVNELAPRPHNSGHYTIEACNISQFAQHIRAIVGLPLLKPKLNTAVVMVNILGQHVQEVLEQRGKNPHWFVHFYGKKERKENRKMGHLTILTEDVEKVQEELEKTKIWNK
ncbi:N5-carboxyaminoimidazole ribonucleotide synthase [Clostridia bacterium]|nr:N5-carboxyaminoimidazole ribonucleotide synthase [Clostridia bacterium]